MFENDNQLSVDESHLVETFGEIQPPKLMVCGHGQHGKDQFCEFLGLKYRSSSEVALDAAIWPVMRDRYSTKQECFDDRAKHRVEWHRLIKSYNKDDNARLARRIYLSSPVYCGIRDRAEFYAAKKEGLFDLSIWIDASQRRAPESIYSCNLFASDCDIVILNNGTLAEFEDKARAFKKIVRGV